MNFLKNMYSQFLYETHKQNSKRPLQETYFLNIADVSIEVTRKKIKNLHLRIYPPDGRVCVSAPVFMSDAAITRFVESKADWIKHQQQKFRKIKTDSPKQYITGEMHFYLGKLYPLRVFHLDNYSKVKLENGTILLSCQKKYGAEKRRSILNEWYRKELKRLVPEKIENWEKIIGVKADEWGIKKMKTKWGTCNRTAKRIWLNLELAKKPMECVEYVIVHELTHFLERYHNAHFKKLMTKYLPDWKSCREKLNMIPITRT
ncbi:MAG: M48 family metallopeptidase [Spirochaetales bacterium]|nr:M48 family metallopeptidase [Spirochaetales bacterium]